MHLKSCVSQTISKSSCLLIEKLVQKKFGKLKLFQFYWKSKIINLVFNFSVTPNYLRQAIYEMNKDKKLFFCKRAKRDVKNLKY